MKAKTRARKRGNQSTAEKDETPEAFWTDPPEELRNRAFEQLGIRSPAQALEDAQRFILKRRLDRLDTADHFRYIELESARVIAALRAWRDQYRLDLQEQSGRSVQQIHWEVYRFGITAFARSALRHAVVEYLADTGVPVSRWEVLFNPGLDFSLPGQPALDSAAPVQAGPALYACVEALLPEDEFDRIVRGGPFGRARQREPAQIEPRHPAFTGMSLEQMVEQRQRWWDEYQPWTESLARLFDAVQEELLFERSHLSPAAQRAEAEFLKLSRLQQIAYKHLRKARHQEKSGTHLGEERWLALMRELDSSGLCLEDELNGQARKVLASVRKKGVKVTTWEEAYRSKAITSLEDDKAHTINRAVMRTLYNAAAKAARRLESALGQKTP
jgi:hypothetical protein